MSWKPIETLTPGILVLLSFADDVSDKCVGYIEENGVCGWPETVAGHLPSGWMDLSALFSGMAEKSRLAVAKAF